MRAQRKGRDDAAGAEEAGLRVEPRETHLAELRPALEATLSGRLVERLEERGIRTLADLRGVGGIREAAKAVDGARVSAQLVNEIDAHLRLSVLPTAPIVNASLIRTGFTTLDHVADMPRDAFATAVGAEIDAETAAVVHEAAGFQTRYLSNLVTGARVGGTYGVSSSVAQALAGVVPQTCACDCRDATSPIAYLADLLDYAVKHLRRVVFANGLTGEYFDGVAFANKKLERVDPTVNFNWGAGAPDPSLQPDAFSVRWTGTIRPRYTDWYTFHVATDDGVLGVKLWVDGQLVVQKSSAGSGGQPFMPAERYGSIYLTGEQLYDIKLECVESGGSAGVRLMWSSWAQPKEIIPHGRLAAAERSEPITLSFLQSRFHQPFRGLSEKCEYMEEPIRQARIACEVLRGDLPPALAGYQHEEYVEAVYRFLLEKIGTSYEELKEAATSTDRELRSRLATRLGILERSGAVVHNHIDELFVDVGVPANLTEDALDSRFAYRSTSRSPLDVGGRGSVLEWRLRRLHQQWYMEDWPPNPPAPTRPLIDPDLVGPPDFEDSKPTASFPRPLVRPMDFFEDRERFVQQTLVELDSVLANPVAGLESLITSTFIDANNQVRSLVFSVTGTDGQLRTVTLGLGTSVADFEELAARRSQGEDVVAEIQSIKLDSEAFDFLAAAWARQNQGVALTVTDSQSVVAIFSAHAKRQMFPAWRSEEEAQRLTLSSDYFRVRPPARPGFEFPWQPRRFRATEAERRAWEDKFRTRIEREQTLIEQMEEAVAAAEEAYLAEIRNELLRIVASPGVLTRARIAALTDRLQLDMQAGVCQTTTRVAQAIETIQGVLFGARNGLLEGHDLELDDPARFDDAWRWLGSFATWKAALRVFLHPENALRPTLRRERTAAFDEVVEMLRGAGRVDLEDAQRAADRYSAFFRDVCSLSFAGLARASAPASGAPDDASVPLWLILARGGHTGKLYYCTQDRRPDSGLADGFMRGLWNAIPGLDSNANIEHVLSYRAPDAKIYAGVYYTSGGEAARKLSFTTFDGSSWSAPRPTSAPVLVSSARLDTGLVPTGPALSQSAITGWTVQPTDRIALLDLDGDGRKELLLLAGTLDADGNRAVGIVRERAGDLFHDTVGRIAGNWELPGGSQTITLRTALVQSPARYREQLLLVDHTGNELGLLGMRPVDGQPAVIAATANGTVAGIGATGPWTVTTGAQFVSADVDGDGLTELIAVEPPTVGRQYYNVAILRPRETGFTHILSQALIAAVPPARLLAVRDSQHPSRDALVVFAPSPSPGASGRMAASVSRWDDANNRLTPGAHTASFAQDDHFLAFKWDSAAPGHALLITSASKLETTVVAVGAEPAVTFPPTPGSQFQIVWTSATRMEPSADGEGQGWTRQLDDHFFAADLDGDGDQELVVVTDDNRQAAVLTRTSSGKLEVAWSGIGVVPSPGRTADGWSLAADSRYIAGDIDGDGCEEILVHAGNRLGVLRGIPPRRRALDLGVREFYGPSGVRAFDVVTQLSERWTVTRPADIRSAYEASRGLSGFFDDDPDTVYLDEAYYFVPIELGLRLRDAGGYPAALDWLRSVYDYERRPEDRKIAFNLVINGDEEFTFVRGPNWLRDPLNPHAVATTRKNSYTRFTILTVVRCLLGFADAEFTRATAESLPRARELYLKALELLEAPELTERASPCDQILGTLEIEIGTVEQRWVWYSLRERLAKIESFSDLSRTVGEVRGILASDGEVRERLAAAHAVVDEADRTLARVDYETISKRDAEARATASLALLADERVARAVERLGYDITSLFLRKNGGDHGRLRLADRPLRIDEGGEGEDAAAAAGDGGSPLADGTVRRIGGHWGLEWVPAPSFSFCIPSNSVMRALRTHADLSLRKLRSCRNIAGMELRVAPYAAPTSADVGAGGDGLPAPQRAGYQPLPYRYPTLIERTRELVELARQLESSMLAAIQSKDHALYEEMKARHDIALARSETRLRDVRLVQAADAVTNAELQRDRAVISAKHLDDLISAGLTTNEQTSIDFLYGAAALHGASATASFIGATNIWTSKGFTEAAGLVASGFSSLAATSSTMSQVLSTYAAYERREQEWRFQRDLGRQDVRIGNQEIRLAQDNVQVVTQERAISGLQLEHAEEILDFLATRRTGTAELYEWMSGVLEQIYRLFLQQATAMAMLAEAQLAFERQEIVPAFIRDDYWEPPAEGAATQGADLGAPNRRGLTGSARLLRDVTELDQYAFRTEQRKLQLTKTISLAQLDPFAFERFRATGVLPFATPMTLFDRDFPGHYLRLIKRVRTSVIALIPPVQGIRATLSTAGTSRVVIGGDTFETAVVQRGPESVALTSPINATGLFELNPQPEILSPFEGIGVDTMWEFSLPKAANLFDYSTIADVLLTIEYTALQSYDYRAQLIQQLDRRIVIDRPFMFRHQFADAWYDLHNADEIDDEQDRMVVRFRTERDDFPPNIENLTIRHVGLYFARASGETAEVEVANLRFEHGTLTLPFTPPFTCPQCPVGGTVISSGTMMSERGLVSTRRANANNLDVVIGHAPVGIWELSLNYGHAAKDAAIRKRFKDEKIADILFVVTYAGETAAWPE